MTTVLEDAQQKVSINQLCRRPVGELDEEAQRVQAECTCNTTQRSGSVAPLSPVTRKELGLETALAYRVRDWLARLALQSSWKHRLGLVWLDALAVHLGGYSRPRTHRWEVGEEA
jgi:hypothetical protein